jgi:hypothetical protein
MPTGPALGERGAGIVPVVGRLPIRKMKLPSSTHLLKTNGKEEL